MGPLNIWFLIRQLSTADVTEISDEELAEVVIGTEQLLNAVHGLSAVLLEEFQRRGRWADDGALSAAGWVAARTGTPVGTLRGRLRAGSALRHLPSAAPAARVGRLSPRHLVALADCAGRHPDLAARDESLLVEQADELDADAFAAVARHWLEAAAAVDGPDPAVVAPTEAVDELHLSCALDGWYRLDGNLSPESGQIVHAALEGEVDRQLRAARDGDPAFAGPTSSLRALALVDLLGQSMRREPSAASVPDRYRVAVVVRAEQTGDLPLAWCDSPAFRVVLTADSEPLDVGRLTQHWPPAIRRAITLRDGGCVFPGCDRPPSWCDVHHCQPWSDGGSTKVTNGALLCRRHHTFVHKNKWSVSVEKGRTIIRRPDGREYVIQRWGTPVAPELPAQAACS